MFYFAYFFVTYHIGTCVVNVCVISDHLEKDDKNWIIGLLHELTYINVKIIQPWFITIFLLEDSSLNSHFIYRIQGCSVKVENGFITINGL